MQNPAALITPLVTFILGVIIGFVLHDAMKKGLSLTDGASKNLLLVTVTIIWLISMLVSIINPAYVVPIPVHGLMGLVVGFFFHPLNGGGKK